MLEKKKLQSAGADFKHVMHAEGHIEAQLKHLKDKVNETSRCANKQVAGPEDDSTLKSVMAALKTVRVEGAAMQFAIDQMHETFNYMRGEFSSDSKLAKQIDKWEKAMVEVDGTFSALVKVAPGLTKEIKPICDAVAVSVKKRLDDFEVEVGEYRAKLFKKELMKGAFSDKVGYPGVYDALAEVSLEVADLDHRMRVLAADAALFEFGEKAEEVGELVTTTRAELVLVKQVWDLSWMVDAQTDAWKSILWNDIQASKLEEETKQFQKLVRGLDKAVRDWNVYSTVDSNIKVRAGRTPHERAQPPCPPPPPPPLAFLLPAPRRPPALPALC